MIIYRCDGYPDCGSEGQEDEGGCGTQVHAKLEMDMFDYFKFCSLNVHESPIFFQSFQK